MPTDQTATNAKVTQSARGMSVSSLLNLYAEILAELRDRGVVRSANSPVGDYAEHLFAIAFDWRLVGNSSAGHDAVGEGKTISNKGSPASPTQRSRQLSFIRKLPEKPFDYLAGILFNENYSIFRAAIIPHSLA